MRSVTAGRHGWRLLIAHDDADGIRVEVADDGIGMAGIGPAADGTRPAVGADRPDRHGQSRATRSDRYA